MKKIVISFLSLAVLAFMVSCEEDTTANISRITYFPDFEISNGAQTDWVELGSAYEEPTATATEGGELLPVETTISGRFTGASSFDVNTADEYSFSFSAMNSDGYPGSASKSAVVYPPAGDMTTSLEGVYMMAVDRVDPPESHDGLEYAMITKVSDDTYAVTHAHGGFYSDGRGYGDGYRFGGMTIKVIDMAANKFEFPTQGLAPSWAGNGPTEVTAAVVDAAAKTISWEATWLGYVFQVTLTQFQP